MSKDTRKTWFITGTSSGFGRAFASYALKKGYNVVATARDPAKLEDLVSQAPDRVLAVALDVNRPRDAEAAVSAALERFPPAAGWRRCYRHTRPCQEAVGRAGELGGRRREYANRWSTSNGETARRVS